LLKVAGPARSAAPQGLAVRHEPSDAPTDDGLGAPNTEPWGRTALAQPGVLDSSLTWVPGCLCTLTFSSAVERAQAGVRRRTAQAVCDSSLRPHSMFDGSTSCCQRQPRTARDRMLARTAGPRCCSHTFPLSTLFDRVKIPESWQIP
jgi:hypothetical protein